MSYLQLQPNSSPTGRKTDYVYMAWSQWSEKKRYSVQKRFYVGRVDDKGENVIVNKKFSGGGKILLPLADVEKQAKFQDKFELWLRSRCEELNPKILGTSDKIAKVNIVGDGKALLSLAKKTALCLTLKKIFGDSEGGALVGLALHQVATGHALYRAQDWLEQRDLPPEMKSHLTGPGAVYGLISRIGSDYNIREHFLREWIKLHGDNGTVLYDTTSISSYSPGLELAEWGYNRDDEKLPQVNFSLAVNKKTGLPLCYRVIPGSIPDVSTLANTLEFLEDFGLRVFTISLDRGFYSGANMRDLLQRKISVVIGSPWSSSQAKNVLSTNKRKLESPRRGFLHEGTPLRHIMVPWIVDMGKEKKPRVIDAHLFLDQSRRAEFVTRYEKTVFALEDKASRENFESAKDARIWINENTGWHKKCLTVKQGADQRFHIERKPNKVAAMTARMGYSLVLTAGMKSGGKIPNQVLDNYRARDAVEKLYDALKNEDGQHRLRTANDNSAQGRFFLGFISLVIRSELDRRMRNSNLRKNMTSAALLDELAKIKSVTTKSGKNIFLEVSKKQRELISRLEIEKSEF
jgi:transposase